MDIRGNHDITLDSSFYSEYGLRFHNQYHQDSHACISLVNGYKSIKFLNHESAEISLNKDNGPQTSFKVFGSPYSPANGLGAFGYSLEEASKIWSDVIPLDTDVVITHTPPKYHCDESKHGEAAGCKALREHLWRVRPHLAICGHVHEGRGAEIVCWDLKTPNTLYKESIVEYWTDPGHDSNKQSFIDLSSESPAPLENIGSWGNAELASDAGHVSKEGSGSDSKPRWESNERSTFTMKIPAEDRAVSYYQGIRGHGGVPPSGRCDMEALAGRLGRKETCIINAAIMASSWPYKEKNGRKYNKPIVVDIDLPVRDGKEDLHSLMRKQENASQPATGHMRPSTSAEGLHSALSLPLKY